MNNKRAWQIFGSTLVLVIIVSGVAGYYLGRSRTFADRLEGDSGEGTMVDGQDSREASMTREEVDPGTTVPDRGAQTAANIAVPEAVAEAAPGVDSKKRQFRVELKGGAFVPDTVIVNQGDISGIIFMAVDGDYDLIQPDHGFKLQLPQGEERLLEGHFAKDGKYMFYCPSCGGPEEGPKGYIIVVPKES